MTANFAISNEIGEGFHKPSNLKNDLKRGGNNFNPTKRKTNNNGQSFPGSLLWAYNPAPVAKMTIINAVLLRVVGQPA